MNETSITRSEGRLGLGLAARWRTFADWWLLCLSESVPSNWLSWINGAPTAKLLMWQDGDLVVCRLLSAGVPREVRIPVRQFGPAAIKTWLAECGLKRDEVIAAPVLEADLFYQRKFCLPKTALNALPQILQQDVLRRTPFQISDIWHAAVQTNPCDEAGVKDVLTMKHWIIRRDLAEAALAKLGLSVIDVDFLAVHEENAEPEPVIAFRAAGHLDPPWARIARNLLAVTVVGVIILGLAVFDWCQSSVAARIETALTESREAAAGINGDLPTRLFALKADVGVLDIWNELSRLLPDHTFLTEMRIKDRRVLITGFSTDAARLVRLIDQSTIFTGAVLVGAITPNATEHKDRFSISFKVRDSRNAGSSGIESGRHD